MDLEVNEENHSTFTWRFVAFYIVMIAPNILSPDLFSPILVMLGFILLFIFNRKVKINYYNTVQPLIGIFLLGMITSLSYKTRDIQRDIIFSLYPISLIYLGFWIADNKTSLQFILKKIIALGIIFSLIHLIQFILNPSLLSNKIDIIRHLVYNPGGNIIILSLIFGTLQYRIGLSNLFPKYFPRFFGLPLLLSSFILSFSRTGLLLVILLSVSLLGFMSRINWKSIISIGIIILGFLFTIFTTPLDEVGTFRSKISNTFKELAISNYQNIVDINLNYRGFETYRTITTFQSGNLKQQILGRGFGGLLDLGVTLNLAGVDYQAIPVLHNGYAYILVKTGILGLLFYLLFYYRILKYAVINNKSTDAEKVLLSKLLLGLTLSLIFYMIAVGGMAELYCSEYVLFLGYILRRMEQL